MRFPFRRHRLGTPDPEALFAEIAAAHPGRTKYSELDRYHDFRNVFLGNNQGRRVLQEILSWGHMFRSSAALAQHNELRTAFFEGERNMALRILTTLNAAPSERPTHTTTKER